MGVGAGGGGALGFGDEAGDGLALGSAVTSLLGVREHAAQKKKRIPRAKARGTDCRISPLKRAPVLCTQGIRKLPLFSPRSLRVE
jgi:hypothetical protein